MNLPDHRKILTILLFFYMAGIIFLSIEETKVYIERLTPYTLLMNIFLIVIFHQPWTARHILVYLFIAITGFLVEAAGVYTGVIFGEYQYGHVLGVKLFDSPLMIGINWLMLIYFVYHIMKKTRLPSWLQITGGSLLMVLYDIILEPVAIRMNMWSWSGGDIPIQNYVAWFIISVVFFSVLHAFKISQRNMIANGLFAIQAGFIFSLNIIYRFI
jgi:bisanhydrobacterioruberin hydratase